MRFNIVNHIRHKQKQRKIESLISRLATSQLMFSKSVKFKVKIKLKHLI